MKYSNDDEVFETVATDRDPREEGATVVYRDVNLNRIEAAILGGANCDCETRGFILESGLIAGPLNFRVTNIGCDFRLEWDCPGCGRMTHEDCNPIDAIPLSEEIREDSLCFSCRGAGRG